MWLSAFFGMATTYAEASLAQEYKTTVNGNEGYIVSGKITTGGTAPASFVNTPYHELPETGGSGTQWITISGLSLMAFPLMVWIFRKRRGAV